MTSYDDLPQEIKDRIDTQVAVFRQRRVEIEISKYLRSSPAEAGGTRRRDEVARLYAEGMSVQEIARHIGVSDVSIRVHLRKGGISMRVKPDTDERNQQIVNSRKSGATYAAIARQHGLSVKGVTRIVILAEREASGCPYGLDGLTVRTKNCVLNQLPHELYELVRQGRRLTPEEVAQHRPTVAGMPNFGEVSEAELAAWLRQHGVAP